MLGNVINSDVALAEVYETEDTVGVRLSSTCHPASELLMVIAQFFESICRTDKDGVIGHLKAHV